MKKILTIFATYDKDNIIDDYVVYYLKKLSSISDIIYVADCDIIENEFRKIKDYVIHIINGRHGEYDFGSYKRGFLYAKDNNLLENYDYLILCNDSCYGPFFDLGNIIDKLKKYHFTGIYYGTAKEVNYNYIGSFFYLLSKDIFLSNIFNDFILSVQKEINKGDIIQKYEFGLSKLMLDNNVVVNSIFTDNYEFKNRPYTDSASLIKEGFPFLKKHCLEKNSTVPLNIDELKDIIKIIKPNYDIKLMVNHLNRVADKEQIKYLFQKYKPYRKSFISDKIFLINNRYSPSGKFLISFRIFNCINIAFNKSIKKSYIECKHNNFDFLL